MIKILIIEGVDVELERFGNNASFEAGGLRVIIEREAAGMLVSQLQEYLAEEPYPTVPVPEAELAQIREEMGEDDSE